MIPQSQAHLELEIGGYGGKSHFRWWSAPPEGWEQLDAITGKLIDLSGYEPTPLL